MPRIHPIQTEFIVSEEEALDNSIYICYTATSEIKFQRLIKIYFN